jgi:hypothetical protein
MSIGLGVWLTRCVVEARAFRKPEGRGGARGRAEESRSNFEFSILNSELRRIFIKARGGEAFRRAA